MTDKVRINVYEAIDAIHGLGVIHGDIRMENVLVLEDESVRFIDFENSAFGLNKEMFRGERAEVDVMFDTLKAPLES
jgi:tRNA A-37 threonylcarbamoyl transferase component Bud32